MGGSISKVSCSEISYHHHKKHQKTFRRHQVKIDKTKIGIPTDFRHTYHVGNESPVLEEPTDNASINKSASISSETDFLATMAQIADALHKLPLHTSSAHYTPRPPPKKMSNSMSDQHMIPRRTFSLLGTKDIIPNIEVSSSMIIQSTREKSVNFSNETEILTNQIITAESTQSFESEEESPPLSPSESHSDESETSPPKSIKQGFLDIDPTGTLHGFSSCLQSRIDAQIVELARVRSKHVKSSRAPRNNLKLDKPTLMI